MFSSFLLANLAFSRFCYCKKQIDVSFLCVCPLTDDKMTQQLCVDPTTLWQCCDVILSSKRWQTQKTGVNIICTANVGKGWFQPKQSGIQQLSHKSYNNIVCLLNWYRAVKKFKSTCISLADNEYNDCSRWLWNSQPAGASRDIPLENFEI